MPKRSRYGFTLNKRTIILSEVRHVVSTVHVWHTHSLGKEVLCTHGCEVLSLHIWWWWRAALRVNFAKEGAKTNGQSNVPPHRGPRRSRHAFSVPGFRAGRTVDYLADVSRRVECFAALVAMVIAVGVELTA